MPPDSAPIEHRHADRDDPVLLYSGVFFSLFWGWGASFFLLIVGAVPAAFLTYGALTKAGFSKTSWVVGQFGDWFVYPWFALSVPMAILWSIRRWRRVHRCRVVLDAEGIEALVWPAAPVRIAWRDVTLACARWGRRAASLVIESRAQRFELHSDDWDLKKIEADVKKYVPVTEHRGS